LLQRREEGKRLEMVVVGHATGRDGINWYTASPPTPSAVVSIIRTIGPGVYKDSRQRTHRIAHDGIVYEQLESGALLLFYSSGGFKAIILSF